MSKENLKKLEKFLAIRGEEVVDIITFLEISCIMFPVQIYTGLSWVVLFVPTLLCTIAAYLFNLEVKHLIKKWVFKELHIDKSTGEYIDNP